MSLVKLLSPVIGKIFPVAVVTEPERVVVIPAYGGIILPPVFSLLIVTLPF